MRSYCIIGILPFRNVCLWGCGLMGASMVLVVVGEVILLIETATMLLLLLLTKDNRECC